jgi:hypothetical protein
MKLVQESLNEFSAFLTGKGKDLDIKRVNHQQLLIGTAVEKEHSTNKSVAMRIALDHLAEHPDYYTKLMEAGLVDEPEAIQLYKNFYKK